MIRGRHRGLPVAIDRAVLLPSEFETLTPEEQPEIRRHSTINHTPPNIRFREYPTKHTDVGPKPTCSHHEHESTYHH